MQVDLDVPEEQVAREAAEEVKRKEELATKTTGGRGSPGRSMGAAGGTTLGGSASPPHQADVQVRACCDAVLLVLLMVNHSC